MTSKNIIVYENDDVEEIPSTPQEFIAFFQEKIDLVPDDFKQTAKVELEPESRWEYGYLSLKISYQRPETEEEIADRKNKAKSMEDANEEKERKLLARLKSKYEI